MADVLSRAYSIVAADPKPPTLRQLRRDLRSRVRDKRVVALVRLRKQIDLSGLRNSYFAMAEPLTIDPDSTCRWQATIVIGEFIETQPDRVWRVARSLGDSRKADIRIAASTVLLEHLLEYHPTQMCVLFEAEMATANKRFTEAVSNCSNFGDGRRVKNRIQKVIDAARIGAAQR